MTTAIVTEARGFELLRGEWNGLLEAAENNVVTLTWEWLATWWRTFEDESRRMRVVLVRRGDELVGAAPLQMRTAPSRHFRVLPYRRLQLLASGEPPGAQICSDYIGWIARRGHEQEVVDAVLEVLTGELSADWDEVILPDMPAGAVTTRAIELAARARGLAAAVIQREPATVLPLAASYDEVLGSLSSSMRYKVRRGLREVQPPKGSYVSASSEAERNEAFDVLVRLHQARWTARGKPGAFRHPKRLAFHQAITRVALERNWLRLGVLSCAGEAVGAIYNFRYGGRVFFYQSGIAVSENQHLRPGLIMHAFEIESAIASGCAEYDFLKRGHSDYKDSWSDTTRDLVCLRLAKPGAREMAYGAAMRAYESLRRLKHRWTEQ